MDIIPICFRNSAQFVKLPIIYGNVINCSLLLDTLDRQHAIIVKENHGTCLTEYLHHDQATFSLICCTKIQGIEIEVSWLNYPSTFFDFSHRPNIHVVYCASSIRILYSKHFIDHSFALLVILMKKTHLIIDQRYSE